MLGEVLGKQTNEVGEYLLDALRCLYVRDGFCFSIQQVEQEDGVEHLQNLRLVDVVGMQVSDNLVHLLGKTERVVMPERQFWLVETDNRASRNGWPGLSGPRNATS